MTDAPRAGRITAVLGPTNTGKTHFAIERMLAHKSGMIGFPLRLLARENYDRVVSLRGPGVAALITGEERIIPPNPSYFLCTVEAMPLDRRVAFLAIDEVQLAADPERGHVFTDRLLFARGEEETMLLGSDTVRRLLRRLVPRAEVVARPRLSTLSYAGVKKITRLPPRSAVIAFSAADVYSLAELMRRRRGGTAVVMGALSPRTRNAQVGMYEAGEVDYMVATDAIGMGLNMDVRHVAFSSLVKFDGRHPRRLTAAETAQIAGRAGRHLKDGTFGSTGDLGPFETDLVDRIENHEFDALRWLYWRNADLDFDSLTGLIKSLDTRPPQKFFRRARDADDHVALAALAREDDIAAMATRGDGLALLWEVCQVPDFRKLLPDHHARMLGQIYRRLMVNDGRLPAHWVEGQIKRLDRTDGEVETLTGRIAHIRTWTYLSHRADWLDDPLRWQERARDIEDRLSDALHERLTQRFVDRRAATLVRRMGAGKPLLAAVTRTGEVLVEGEYVGRLDGFRFCIDAEADRDDARALTAAAMGALRGDVETRLRRLESEDDDAFTLAAEGHVLWRGAVLARLRPGPDILRPTVDVLPSELLEPAMRERLRKRLSDWLANQVSINLGPLVRARDGGATGSVRGILYQLVESLGAMPRQNITARLTALSNSERKELAGFGVRLGTASIYLAGLTGRKAVALRSSLWGAQQSLTPPPLPEGPSCSVKPGAPAAFYEACGYRVANGRAVRVDRLEKLAVEARRLARQGPFAATAALAAAAGCDGDALAAILFHLGYRAETDPTGVTFRAKGRPRRSSKSRLGKSSSDTPGKSDGKAAEAGKKHGKKAKQSRRKDKPVNPDSPFARLKELMNSR